MSTFKKGNTWYVKFQMYGEQHVKSVGTGSTKEEAEELETIMRNELRQAKVLGFVFNKTLSEALAKWLDEYVVHLAGSDKYHSHVRAISLYMNEETLLTDVFKVAEEITVDGQRRGLGAATINRRLSALKRVANLAHSKWKWLAESPHGKFDMLPESKGRDVICSQEEIEQLCSETSNPFMAGLIRFAAYTGVRAAEAWRMNRNEDGTTCNDMKDGVMKIKGKGKGASRGVYEIRHVPMLDEHIEFIDKYAPFTANQHMAMREFDVVRQLARLRHVNFHDLRHTFGTWLAKDGQPMHVIMKLMGHKTSGMAMRYINMNVEDMRGAMPTAPKRKPKKQTHLKRVK